MKSELRTALEQEVVVAATRDGQRWAFLYVCLSAFPPVLSFADSSTPVLSLSLLIQSIPCLCVNASPRLVVVVVVAAVAVAPSLSQRIVDDAAADDDNDTADDENKVDKTICSAADITRRGC